MQLSAGESWAEMKMGGNVICSSSAFCSLWGPCQQRCDRKPAAKGLGNGVFRPLDDRSPSATERSRKVTPQAPLAEKGQLISWNKVPRSIWEEGREVTDLQWPIKEKFQVSVLWWSHHRLVPALSFTSGNSSDSFIPAHREFARPKNHTRATCCIRKSLDSDDCHSIEQGSTRDSRRNTVNQFTAPECPPTLSKSEKYSEGDKGSSLRLPTWQNSGKVNV